MKRPFLVKFPNQTVIILPEELPKKKGIPMFNEKTIENHLRQHHPDVICRFKYNQMINQRNFDEIDRHCRSTQTN